MSARPRIALFAILLAVAGALAFVVFRYIPGTRAAAPQAPTAVPVSVAQVVQKSVPVTLHAIGNVEPYTSVAVKARVDGQIVAVRFREGDEVRQGAVLFEIDRRPFDAQLAQAQANLLKDQALLTHARDQDRRYKDLLERKFISADAYAQMKTNVATAEATVRADEAAISGIRPYLRSRSRPRYPYPSAPPSVPKSSSPGVASETSCDSASCAICSALQRTTGRLRVPTVPRPPSWRARNARRSAGSFGIASSASSVAPSSASCIPARSMQSL